MRRPRISLFPAHAGMNRGCGAYLDRGPSVPRARGDEPIDGVYVLEANDCSPRTRG